jgi:predicted TIM-barrel fold metal-dependent hydrolase
MIVDCHYHLEEQLETVEELLKQMALHKVQRVALISKMNEPFHLKPIPKKASELLPPLLLGNMRFLGLILYNSTVTSDGQLSTLGTKYALYHKPDNTYIHQIIQEYPDKFYGWIFINPKTMDPMTEVERWAGKQGWVGVKTHPFWHGYPVSMLDDVAAYCQEMNLPLLNAKEKENVYVDLSSLVYTNQRVLSSVIETLGVEKCLYGTDGPYAGATQKRMLDRVLQLSLSGSEQEQILGKNFLELIEA